MTRRFLVLTALAVLLLVAGIGRIGYAIVTTTPYRSATNPGSVVWHLPNGQVWYPIQPGFLWENTSGTAIASTATSVAVLQMRNDSNTGWVIIGGGSGGGGTSAETKIISAPSIGVNVPFWEIPSASHIIAVQAACYGGSSAVGFLDYYNTALADAGALGSAADITATAGASATSYTFTTPVSVTAGSYLGWHTTAMTGSATSIILSFQYTTP